MYFNQADISANGPTILPLKEKRVFHNIIPKKEIVHYGPMCKKNWTIGEKIKSNFSA